MARIFLIICLAFAAPSHASTPRSAVVKDESCPFLRWGADVTREKLFHSLSTLTASLRELCGKEASSANALDALLKKHEQEIDSVAEAKEGPSADLREVPIRCESNRYEHVLAAEYQTALEKHRRGQSIPGGIYESAFNAPTAEERMQAAQKIYRARLSEFDQQCARENAENEKVRKKNARDTQSTMDDLSYEEVGILARASAEDAADCYQRDKKKNEAVKDSAISTLVELAALSAASQPMTAGAAFGVLIGKDMLSHLLHRFSVGEAAGDPRSDVKDLGDREAACIALNGIKGMFDFPGCKSDTKEDPVKIPPPPGSPEITEYALALLDLQEALKDLQNGSAQSILMSQTKPHPLDKLHKILLRPIPTSIGEGPDTEKKAKPMELYRYAGGLSSALYQYASSEVVRMKEPGYSGVSKDYADRARKFIDAYANWAGVPSPIGTALNPKDAIPALPAGFDPGRALVLRSRGLDLSAGREIAPENRHGREGENEVPVPSPVDILAVADRYWEAMPDNPYAHFKEWQKTYLKDTSAAALRHYLNSQTGPVRGTPPALAYPIDQTSELMNNAFTAMLTEFKPHSDAMLRRALESLNGSGIPVARVTPEGESRLLRPLGKSHADPGRPETGRGLAGGSARREPTADERRDRSQKFDALAMGAVRACGYLSASQFLCGRETAGTQSNFCFEELASFRYPWKRRTQRLANAVGKAAADVAKLAGGGSPAEGFDLYLSTCLPLACKNSPVPGLSVFEHTTPVDKHAEKGWKSSELNRFKKEYCSNVSRVDETAVRLKANYECFDQLCAPAAGDPAWNLPCAQRIRAANR